MRRRDEYISLRYFENLTGYTSIEVADFRLIGEACCSFNARLFQDNCIRLSIERDFVLMFKWGNI